MRIRRLPTAALALLALAAPLAGVETSETEHRAFDLPAVAGHRFLLVDNVTGSVIVRAGSGDRIELELRKSYRSDGAAGLERARRETKLTVEQEPGRLALVQDGEFRCDRAVIDLALASAGALELHGLDQDSLHFFALLSVLFPYQMCDPLKGTARVRQALPSLTGRLRFARWGPLTLPRHRRCHRRKPSIPHDSCPQRDRIHRRCLTLSHRPIQSP